MRLMMCFRYFPIFYLLLNVKVTETTRCENIRISMCMDFQGLRYNSTIMPNIFHHRSQEEAEDELNQLVPIVNTHYSPYIRRFLCHLYIPACNVLKEALPPCRDVCLSAKEAYSTILGSIDYPWPDRLNCENFPEHGLCMDARYEPVPGRVEVDAVPMSSNVINVSWSLPSGSSDHDITKYEIRYRSEFMTYWRQEDIETNNTWYVLQDLGAYNVYSIIVTAYNDFGIGEPSQIAVARTLEGVPGAPVNFTLEVVNSTCLLASWEPPPRNMTNGIIQGYRLRFKLRYRRYAYQTRDTWAEYEYRKVRGNKTSVLLNGLNPNYGYMAQVSAYTSIGTGPKSRNWYARTPDSYVYRCREGWVRGEENCYYVSREKLNWVDSQIACMSFFGKLVEISYQQKNDDLKKIARESGKRNFWIGVSDLEINNRFRFMHDRNWLTLNDWSDDSPDPDDGKNCVTLRKKNGYRWHVTRCSKLNYYICERVLGLFQF